MRSNRLYRFINMNFFDICFFNFQRNFETIYFYLQNSSASTTIFLILFYGIFSSSKQLIRVRKLISIDGRMKTGNPEKLIVMGIVNGIKSQYLIRTLVKDVVRRTLIEIAEEGHAFTLHQAVDILNKSVTSLKTVQMSNVQLKRLLDDTKNELVTKRYHRNLELRKYDETVASLKDEIRDSQINSKAQLCYVEKWLCASTNALEFRHKIKPASVPRQEHEERVHDEIVRAYELQIKEREELLSYWICKYRDDLTNISNSVIQQREMLKVTITRRQELTKLYDYHAGEMRAWLTFKKERAARLAREQRSRLAATRIQAWWKGLMVRRALGAFKHLRNLKKTITKTKKK